MYTARSAVIRFRHYDTPAGVVGSVRADRARGETAARAARARRAQRVREPAHALRREEAGAAAQAGAQAGAWKSVIVASSPR